MGDLPMLELSGDFKEALDVLEQTGRGEAVFVTGKAGTGKSTLLRLFRQTTRKSLVVLAPTGIAALQVQGQTIHSFFGFPPKLLLRKDIKPSRYKGLYRKIDAIVIDEISMVRAEVLDNIDYFLRLNGDNPLLPFGGVQMIFFGDLFQLPPVIANEEERRFIEANYESPYFFSATVFRHLAVRYIELQKVYRQEERGFIRLLDSVRVGIFDYDDLSLLNSRHIPAEAGDDDQCITISTRNSLVDQLNAQKLNQLQSPIFSYVATVTGDFSPNIFPTELVLQLREGAQVMFVRNDPERRFVNGTIGTVVELSDSRIVVAITDAKQRTQQLEVPQLMWEVIRYRLNNDGVLTDEVVGTFKQYPLKLAWAITIHKSQGQTFRKVILNMGQGAFEYGQTYVALSRCTHLDGITLRQPIRPNDILVDSRVAEFYQQHFR
jgi:ATP-dependent DNA helicase PIF1